MANNNNKKQKIVNKTNWILTKQILNKKLKKEGKIHDLKLINFLIKDPEPDQSRPDPQHWPPRSSLADLPELWAEGLGQPNGRRWFSLPQGGGGDTGHHHVLPVLPDATGG